MRFRQFVSILLAASSCALLFGCSGGAAKTVKADGLRYTVLQEDVPLTLKLSPSDYRCNLVFTAPEDGEYTFWDESDQYAFLRFYTDPEQLFTYFHDTSVSPYCITVPMTGGQTLYLMHYYGPGTKGEAVVHVTRGEHPVPDVNYGQPIPLEAGSKIALDHEQNYTPRVYSFTAPKSSSYVFRTEGEKEPTLQMYADAWCTELLAEGDRTEVPTDDYYTVTDTNFSIARTMEQGETVYFTLSVRTTENEGYFYIEEAENAD